MTVAHLGPPRALDTLREQIAPNANDAELQWLAAVGQRFDLDPIAGHVVLIGRWDSRVGRTVHRPQITADGRLVLADRTGELEGIDGPEWTGPRNPDGGHTWADVWDGDDPPHAARAFVHRRGRRPANGTVRWSEFAQRDRQGRLVDTWARMGAHMLAKTAISLAVRRQFPSIIPADADVDDDLAGAEWAAAPTPAAAHGPAIDDDLRQALIERAEALRADNPKGAAWLLREWRHLGGPTLSDPACPVTRLEGDMFRRLLEDVETSLRDFQSRRSGGAVDAWIGPDTGEPTPADVHDDAPEAAQHQPDDPPKYDPADAVPS